MELAERDITAGAIMTREAFENAIIIHSAIGGSTNATIHLPSIARELGITLEPELFDDLNHKVPHIGNINPSGQHLTESFWFAGGIPMVQIYLKDMLHLDVMTVTGKTLGENLEDFGKRQFFLPVTWVIFTIMVWNVTRSFSLWRKRRKKAPLPS